MRPSVIELLEDRRHFHAAFASALVSDSPAAAVSETVALADTDVSAILDAAHAVPTNEVLSVLGPIMRQALTRILNGDQVDPVVRSVLEQLK